MKIIKIILLSLILSIILIQFNNNIVFADDYSGTAGMVDQSVVEGIKPKFTKSSYKLKSFSEKILGLIRNIAVISSVVILAYCGMRITFGSLEQRAEYKKSLMPLIIGVLVVLMSTTIVSIVQNIIDGNNASHIVSSEEIVRYDVPYHQGHAVIKNSDGWFCTSCNEKVIIED